MKEQPPKRKAGGKPFQSKLEPYFDEIRAARLARKTWAQIAEQIAKGHGVDCTPPGVYAFFKTKRKRRYALGMEPDPAPAAPSLSTPAPAAGLTPSPEPDAQAAARAALRAKAKALSSQPAKPAWDLHVDDDKPLKG